jgi:hypothetical protein
MITAGKGLPTTRELSCRDYLLSFCPPWIGVVTLGDLGSLVSELHTVEITQPSPHKDGGPLLRPNAQA